MSSGARAGSGYSGKLGHRSLRLARPIIGGPAEASAGEQLRSKSGLLTNASSMTVVSWF